MLTTLVVPPEPFEILALRRDHAASYLRLLPPGPVDLALGYLAHLQMTDTSPWQAIRHDLAVRKVLMGTARQQIIHVHADSRLADRGLTERHFLRFLFTTKKHGTHVRKAWLVDSGVPFEVNWMISIDQAKSWEWTHRTDATERPIASFAALVRDQWAQLPPPPKPRTFQDPGGALPTITALPRDVWMILLETLDTPTLVTTLRGASRQLRRFIDSIVAERVERRRAALTALRARLAEVWPNNELFGPPLPVDAELAEGAYHVLWPHRHFLRMRRGFILAHVQHLLFLAALSSELRLVKRLQPPNPRNQLFLGKIMHAAALTDNAPRFTWAGNANNALYKLRDIVFAIVAGDSYRTFTALGASARWAKVRTMVGPDLAARSGSVRMYLQTLQPTFIALGPPLLAAYPRAPLHGLLRADVVNKVSQTLRQYKSQPHSRALAIALLSRGFFDSPSSLMHDFGITVKEISDHTLALPPPAEARSTLPVVPVAEAKRIGDPPRSASELIAACARRALFMTSLPPGFNVYGGLPAVEMPLNFD